MKLLFVLNSFCDITICKTSVNDDNNVNICKLSGTLVRDIISNNLPNSGYLIDDKIYKYLKKQKENNRKIFIH